MAVSSSIFSSRTEYADARKSLYKSLILLCLVIGMDWAVGEGLRFLYFRTTSGRAYRITYALEKTDQAALVFGSSKASNHYVPDVFEKGLGLSFYNNGEDGQGILYALALLKSTLKRYTPEVIILDIVPSDLEEGSEFSVERLSVLLPYYQTRPELRGLLESRSRLEKVKLLSRVYPFNNSILGIIAGNFEFNKDRVGDTKGYMPLPFGGQIKPLAVQEDKEPPRQDVRKVKALEEFCLNAVSSGSKVFLVISPHYSNNAFSAGSMAVIQAIAGKYKVPLLDYSQKAYFLERGFLFSDRYHLNEKGAEAFSQMLYFAVHLFPPL